MKKKRLLLFVLCAYLAIITQAQISTSSWHDGYWGQWRSHTIRYGFGIPDTDDYKLYGNYSGFIIYKNGAHPSEFIFKFSTDGYWEPTKKEIKEHLKTNEWYEYSGWVEYYVTEDYPTIAAVLKAFDFPYFNCNSGSNGNPCAKRLAKAKIRIAPYKKQPKCYNIYFDDVAVGIDMENTYFKNK